MTELNPVDTRLDRAVWRNAVVRYRGQTNTHVLFDHEHGGYVYRCTKEQWARGVLSQVEG
jgi:hypothetical protein